MHSTHTLVSDHVPLTFDILSSIMPHFHQQCMAQLFYPTVSLELGSVRMSRLGQVLMLKMVNNIIQYAPTPQTAHQYSDSILCCSSYGKKETQRLSISWLVCNLPMFQLVILKARFKRGLVVLVSPTCTPTIIVLCSPIEESRPCFARSMTTASSWNISK